MTHSPIAIFASGAGSNARRLMEEEAGHAYRTALVVCSKKTAGVIDHAKAFDVPIRHIDRSDIDEPSALIADLRQRGVEWIVLAGFLWLLPTDLLAAFPDRILNIHPALLPLYGGKGMYGMHVHRAVVADGRPETGITIHRVNERYDDGEIVFQARTRIDPHDTPEDVARAVQALEHRHFPAVVDALVRGEAE